MTSDVSLIESSLAIIVVVCGFLGWVWRSLTARIDSDIKGVGEKLIHESVERAREDADLRHDLKNLATKQDALAREHDKTVRDIVEVKTTVLHLKDAVDRTDKNVLELLKRHQD